MIRDFFYYNIYVPLYQFNMWMISMIKFILSIPYMIFELFFKFVIMIQKLIFEIILAIMIPIFKFMYWLIMFIPNLMYKYVILPINLAV